jgi:hypothetical protein
MLKLTSQTVKYLFLITILFLLASLFRPAKVSAATYYVSTSGNDSNNGSLSSPFATIQRAANVAVAGDFVQVRAGTYYQKFAPVNSGTSTAYITYMPYPGESAIIDGTGVPLSSSGYQEGLIQIVGKSYIRIQGFTIRNSSYHGINIRLSDSGVWSSHIEISGNTILNTSRVGIKATRSRFVTVRNNTIRHVDYSSGIGIWFSEDVTVDRNTIDTPHWYHECQGGYEEGLSIASVNRFVVSYNSLDYSEAPPAGYCETAIRLGIDVKESSQNGTVHHNTVRNFNAGGIYTDGWEAGSNGTPTLNHVNIYQNYVEEGGIQVNCERSVGTVEYINIFNNLVVNGRFTGIAVKGSWGDGLKKNINIYNNTIYGASPAGGNGGAGIYIMSENLGTNNSDRPVIIRNNISNFYFLSTGGGTVGQIRAINATVASMVTADHNIVYGPQVCAIDYTACVELGTRVTASPASLYVNPSTFNLHLRSGSPAINAGATISLFTIDYDGATRPQGSAYDIGAYEYGGVIPSSTPTPGVLTPTPTRAPLPTGTIPTPTSSFYPTPTPRSATQPAIEMERLNFSTLYQSIQPNGGAFTFSSNLSIGGIISSLLNYFFPIAGSLFILFIIFGGFKFMTSAGNPETIASAKSLLLTAFLGFIMIFSSYWITRLIASIFGLGEIVSIF